jgi:hypothetical protein
VESRLELRERLPHPHAEKPIPPRVPLNGDVPRQDAPTALSASWYTRTKRA